MAFPPPAPAQVIRYAYLWHKDALRGEEEGSKDRPCAIIMTVRNEENDAIVTVLPITHSPPLHAADALEIPLETKKRLGLDDDRSWVVISESNRFTWPGPDLRMARAHDAASILYGNLPYAFFEKLRRAFIAKIKAARTASVIRTE